MKVTLESTDKILTLVDGTNELPARVWQGTTEGGIKVACFVTRLAVELDEDQEQFEAELIASGSTPVHHHWDAIPARFLL